MGTQKNRINETVLLSTQNICYKLWVRKYTQFYNEIFFLPSLVDYLYFSIIATFTGDPGRFVVGLGYYNGYPFSTYDNDKTGYYCAETCQGGGWYAACCDANPNGQYITPGEVWSDPDDQFNPGYGGMIYHDWMEFKSLKTTQMMFRRA